MSRRSSKIAKRGSKPRIGSKSTIKKMGSDGKVRSFKKVASKKRVYKKPTKRAMTLMRKGRMKKK